MEERLSDFLRSLCTGGVALAFSGGVDSSLLLHALIRLREEKNFPLVAFFFRTPFQTSEESQGSLSCAAKEGCEYEQIIMDPLQLPELKNNPPNRCYICKHALFTTLGERARKRGLSVMMDGTNADDLKQYRPGLRALRELGVLSPLAEVRMSKEDVRALANRWGLPCASRPSAPCLATRFEYGVALTKENLKRAARGEELLRSLFPGEPMRLRVHGDLARIELPSHLLLRAAQQAEEISASLRRLGFFHVTLDLEGLRSGSMDISLKKYPDLPHNA